MISIVIPSWNNLAHLTIMVVTAAPDDETPVGAKLLLGDSPIGYSPVRYRAAQLRSYTVVSR